MQDKYFFNNYWRVNHPTINFFTFEVYCVKSFGHKCIIEHVQDGEIWSDDEYWGSIFYDFENDRYKYMSTYLDDGDEIERILKIWMNNQENPNDIWDGKISEDFEDEKEKCAINFYKAYIESGLNTNIENFYQLMTRKI